MQLVDWPVNTVTIACYLATFFTTQAERQYEKKVQNLSRFVTENNCAKFTTFQVHSKHNSLYAFRATPSKETFFWAIASGVAATHHFPYAKQRPCQNHK